MTEASVGVMIPPRMPPKMMAGMPRGMMARRNATQSSERLGRAAASMPPRRASR